MLMISPSSSSIHHDILSYIFDRGKKVICNLQNLQVQKKPIVDMVYNFYILTIWFNIA